MAEGYSALSERKRNTELQEPTLGLERSQTQMDRVEAMYRAAEIGINSEKKEEKLVDRKLYIPNWNKHPVTRTDNKLA